MIRVLLADDQRLLREGLRVILELQADIEVVAEADDGPSAITLAREHSPDVALLDIQMPGLDGLTVAERLLGRAGGPKVLVLTSFDTDEHLLRALRAGVSGFLLKDAPRAQLVSAVRAVVAGEELIAPSITRRLVERFASQRSPAAEQRLARLTQRELDVLRRVAAGLSNSEIAAELFLGEATVKTHLGNVLAKCDLRDRAQAVVLAYESGLVRPGQRGTDR